MGHLSKIDLHVSRWVEETARVTRAWRKSGSERATYLAKVERYSTDYRTNPSVYERNKQGFI
jgi:hypothetical protein